MGVQTIIHGRINLKGNFEKSREFIKKLENDEKYPWIRTEMFSLGAIEKPYYYNEPIIGFAADYKGLENDWKSFVIKFEHILKNIEFENAKIQMETEFVGTYNFIWMSKSHNEKFEEKEQLIETDNFYFGFGNRCRWGTLNEDLKEEHIFDLDFEYPIRFDLKTKNEFNELLDSIKINETIYIKDKIRNFEKLYPILTFGNTNGVINYDFESEKGYWIKKLKEEKIK